MKANINSSSKMRFIFILAKNLALVFSIFASNEGFALMSTSINKEQNSSVHLTCRLINGVPNSESGRLLGVATFKLNPNLGEEEYHNFEVVDHEYDYFLIGTVILQKSANGMTSFHISAQDKNTSAFFLFGGVEIWPVKSANGQWQYPTLAIRAENPTPVARPVYYMECFQIWLGK